MIVIESKIQSLEGLRMRYPNAIIADVTSEAKDALARLSPSFPHGEIPIPNSGWATAYSVEAIWQGLKVFENEDINKSIFARKNTVELKRNTSGLGKMIGHRYGMNGLEILKFSDAQKRIFIPCYRWVLDYKVQDIIKRLRKANETKAIVLLDYNTNCDLNNYREPISCAYLVKAYAEGLPPYEDVYETIVIHHTYTGRKVISWTTEERHVKAIPLYEMPQQLELPLDYKYN